MVGTQAVRFVQLTHADASTTATIVSGGATSGAVDFSGANAGGFLLPATFDGTAMTFTVCDTLAGTYVGLQNAAGSAAVSVTVAASKGYPLPVELAGWPYFKFVAGTNQSTSDTVITVTRKR